VETQEDHIFSHHYLWNRSAYDIVMFGYVDVVNLKDIPPEYGRSLLELCIIHGVMQHKIAHYMLLFYNMNNMLPWK